MAVIHIKVTGHRAEKVSEDWLASGSAGVDSLIIDTIDSSWEGYNIAAAFKVQDQLYYSVIDNNIAIIPAAALVNDFVLLGLYGTKAGAGDTELRYSTNYVPLRPKAGPGTGGVTPPEPSESLYNEIRDIAETAEATANEVAAAAARGDFDGEPGPQGETGPQGPQGETGPQGPQGEPGEVTAAQLAAGLLSKADVITDTLTGTVGSTVYASNMPLQGLTVYGQTTQVGSPTPITPVDVISATPTVTITDGSDTQAVTLPVLRGLPTIYNNYTTYIDGNGQRWYTDTLDLAAGKIYRRIGYVIFNGSETWSWAASGSAAYTPVGGVLSNVVPPLSTRFIVSDTTSTAGIQDGEVMIQSNGRIFFRVAGITSIEAWQTWLAANNTAAAFGLATPEEEDIAPGILALLRALHTYNPNTNISVDTWLNVIYRADTKAYIDNKITQAIQALM